MLTNRALSADEALQWGLVNRVVKPAELMPTARAIADEVPDADVHAVELETRLAAVQALFAASRNINEQGWLNAARRALEARLGP